MSYAGPTRCPNCGSTNLLRDPEQAEIVCTRCGLVIETDLMDYGPEWRAFDDDQRTDRVRVGAPITYTIHDKGLTTTIDWRDKAIEGKNITPDKRAQIRRMRKWHRRIRIYDAQERNLANALSEITRIADNLGLSLIHI